MISRAEQLAVGVFLAALQRNSVPIRRSSSQRPPLWSVPLIKTAVQPVSYANWTDIIEVPRIDNYFTSVQQYFATWSDLVYPGIQYRFLLDETDMTNYVDLTTPVDRFKESPTTYPVVKRPIDFFLASTSKLVLQVKGTGNVLAGIFGYYAPAKDATVLDSFSNADT